MAFHRLALCFLLLASCFVSLIAESREPVRVELISEATQVRPGDSFRAGVRLQIEEGWHVYGRDPGLSGLPTEVAWHLPDGVTAGDLQYPPTVPFEFMGEEGDGYEGTVVLWSLIETTSDLEGPIELRATASWLVCSDICIPGDAESALTLQIGSATLLAAEMEELFITTSPEPEGASAGSTTDEVGSLPYILLLGLLGGLILNLMPCVFPILGLKIMGFVNQAGEERGKIVAHGLVFTAGVLVSFWILAGILIALRAGGQELGWGFQLQEPGFVLALAVVLLVFGLNMSGLFEIGFSAVGVGSKLTAKSGMAGSFFSGALATVVATPCAAPFLAPALGGALALPPLESIAVFTAIAFGLALPYLTLSAFPHLASKLPRPGAWMESLKQFLSFLLYGTVAYLLWVLADQLGAGLLLTTFFALIAVAMACWVYGRWSAPHRPRRTQWIARGIALVLLAAPLGYVWNGIAEEEQRREMIAQVASGEIQQDFLIWEPWTPEREAELRREGRFVYIDFTARWCATCQVNKRAYESAEVIQALLRNDVALLRADWTNKDPAITRALASFNRSAIPFNLLYAPEREAPLILPEGVFGPGAVLEALREAGAEV
jgi:thiol:disulfide interchange protein